MQDRVPVSSARRQSLLLPVAVRCGSGPSQKRQTQLVARGPSKYNCQTDFASGAIGPGEPPLSSVDWQGFRKLMEGIPYGKVLPTAVYLHRESPICQTGPIGNILQHVATAHGISDDFNVVKLRKDAQRLSFLSYPAFYERAHPELSQAIAIDLLTGKRFDFDYSDSLNPPILHRKELLLPPGHPRRGEYAGLSEKEEAAGLYLDTTVIGFRSNWERLLTERGVGIQGHELTRLDGAQLESLPPRRPSAVHRHRTALTRYTLSKPVKTLLEYGQLPPGTTVFDYGCGLGADVRGLSALGYEADGWDPVHAPHSQKHTADVVNLGYVLNVIEDPAERITTLADAWSLTGRLLVVSSMIGGASRPSDTADFQDGVLTKRNTFQKYFDQQELQQYLDDALDRVAVPVSLGIFYVFRGAADQQSFLQARSRTPVDWDSLPLGFERPQPRVREPHIPRPDLYALHQELVEAFWTVCVELGRLPLPTELPRHDELVGVFGSSKRALSGLLRQGRDSAFQSIQAARRNDLLVYLAASTLRRKLGFSQLPAGLREDIKTFFGNYSNGLDAGLKLLRSAADPNMVALACEEAAVGWQDADALYVHSPLVSRLPALLRTYVGCGELLYGDARQADVVKIHKQSGKVTFLTYESFDTCLLPALLLRAKVNLRTLWVDVFDHAEQGELLYYKERFLAADHPQHQGLLAVRKAFAKLQIPDASFLGPKLDQLKQILGTGMAGKVVMKAVSPRIKALLS